MEKELKGVTQDQMVKAAQEFGVDLDAAINYLTVHDPDADGQAAEPDFLTEVTQGLKVDSSDQRDAEAADAVEYDHTQRCAAFEIYLFSSITNCVSIIVSWVCAFVFEQYYLMGVTGYAWYWASQITTVGNYKYLKVVGRGSSGLEVRWNVESDKQCFWSTKIAYSNIQSFRRTDCGGQSGCDKTAVSFNGNGCKCFKCCKVCENQDLIVFELNESFVWNNCCGLKTGMCQCCNRTISKIVVSTDDLKGLADFLQSKGIKEDGQNTADI